MTLKILYYSISFIVALFVISKLTIYSDKSNIAGDDIKALFKVLCIIYVIWSFYVVIIGISSSAVIDKVFLFISEFVMSTCYIAGIELMSSVTDRTLMAERTSHSIISKLLYISVFVIIVRLIIGKADISNGIFGAYFTMNFDISFVLRIVFYVVILFIYGAYTYMHYYMNNTKRQRYISRQCGIIGFVAAISILIETLGYTYLHSFIPSMYVGMFVILIKFSSLIRYKRKIEYNVADYKDILSPSNEKPAFVCDDYGKILFENTRAFVMRQTYKDSYVGKLLTDVFVISDYDKDRLKEPRNTQKFEIYCKYPKEEKEILLIAKHNLDKFSDIFSTEIEVSYAAANGQENENGSYAEGTAKDIKNHPENPVLSFEIVNDIRTKALIKAIESQKRFYENGNKALFEMNLKAIEKASSVIGLPALVELCDRIKTELSYGDWEGLNPLMIDLDRQYETLMFINY